MSAAKQKWSEAEERALREGVGKYGSGKWRAIQRDQELGPLLRQRSNVDLKDKWRNMALSSPLSPGSPDSARGSPGSREKAAGGRARPDSGADASARLGESEEEASPLQRYEAMILETMHRLGPAQAWTAEAILQCMQEHDSLSATSRREAFLCLRMMCASGGIEKLETETRPYLYRIPAGSAQAPPPSKQGQAQGAPQGQCQAESPAAPSQQHKGNDALGTPALRETQGSKGSGDEGDEGGALLSFATRRVRGKRGGTRAGDRRMPGAGPGQWGPREQASAAMEEACAALTVAEALAEEARELEERAQEAERQLAAAIAAAHQRKAPAVPVQTEMQ